MSNQTLASLGLEEERVVNAARFCQSYARTALRELHALMAGEDDAELVQRGVSDARSRAASIWAARAEVATSFREAAQWALHIAPGAAIDLLRQSSEHYIRNGQAYGGYLSAAIGESAPQEWLAAELGATDSTRGGVDADASATVFLRTPQQLAYLLLAVGNSVDVVQSEYEMLDRVLRYSPHRDGVVPVGSLGVPIRQFWNIADHIARPRADSAAVIANQISGMCERYADSMQLAQSNTHLWQHCAAPVDVTDLEIIGITCISVHRLGQGVLNDALTQSQRFQQLDGLALVPLSAALDLLQAQTDRRAQAAEPRRDSNDQAQQETRGRVIGVYDDEHPSPQEQRRREAEKKKEEKKQQRRDGADG